VVPRLGHLARQEAWMRGKQLAWTAVIALAVVVGYDYAKAKKQ
jgi:hypothetical protein